VYGLVNTTTTEFVQSEAFQKLWNGINRSAHVQIVSLLTGKKLANGVLSTKNGVVTLDLSQVVENVKDRLVSAGITVASQVPAVGATIEIANVKGLTQAQNLVRALNTVADWLPWIGLALVAVGAVAAHRRRRALMAAAIGLGAGMIIVGIGLLIGRNIYLSDIPTDKLPRSTAAFIFDTLVRYLRWGLRLVFLVALLVALGLWLSGPSGPAVAFRRTVSNFSSRFAGSVRAGPVGQFLARYVNVFRVGIVAIGGIVLLLIDGPSLATVIVLAVIVVLLLVLLEVLKAPSGQTAAGTSQPPDLGGPSAPINPPR